LRNIFPLWENKVHHITIVVVNDRTRLVEFLCPELPVLFNRMNGTIAVFVLFTAAQTDEAKA
jgi:hypothetical protein